MVTKEHTNHIRERKKKKKSQLFYPFSVVSKAPLCLQISLGGAVAKKF